MLRVFAILLGSLLAATAAHAQLMSERVENGARICRYAPSGLSSARQVTTGTSSDDELEQRLRETAAREARVRGSGEREVTIDGARSCPPTFPDEQEPRILIPTFATLESERRINGELNCVYQYLGQRYVISLGQRSVCPYTPVGINY